MIDSATGFIVGFVGSLHCIGMCGPIALALPAGAGGLRGDLFGRLAYNLGRVVTYVSLGALVGSLGGVFAMGGVQQWMSIGVGLIMLVGALLPSLLRAFSGRWGFASRFHTLLRGWLTPLFERRTVPALAAIGMLNGLLPCGFVYVALGTALTLGGMERGMLFLAGFGFGTIPAMFGIGLVGKLLQGGVRQRLSVILPLFTAALAVLLILRGLNLGIPFVSPRIAPAGSPTSAAPDCCHGE